MHKIEENGKEIVEGNMKQKKFWKLVSFEKHNLFLHDLVGKQPIKQRRLTNYEEYMRK